MSRTPTTSKVEFFVTLVKGFQPLTNVNKNPIFYVARTQDSLCRHCEIKKESQKYGQKVYF